MLVSTTRFFLVVVWSSCFHTVIHGQGLGAGSTTNAQPVDDLANLMGGGSTTGRPIIPTALGYTASTSEEANSRFNEINGVQVLPIRMNDRVNNRTKVACPSNAAIRGYDTITDLNVDMQNEYDRIQSGAVSPLSQYFFVLCPMMYLDANVEQLNIKLPNTNFVCSTNGFSNDTCLFRFGETQILAEDPIVSSVTFRGITFDKFTTTAVNFNMDVPAGSAARALFYDCIFSDFNAPNLIQVNIPMRVDIQYANIHDGTGVHLFPNRQGNMMNLNSVIVDNTTATSLLRTSDKSTSFLSYSTISSSSIQQICNTDTDSDLTVNDVIIKTMVDMQYAFFATINSRMSISILDMLDTVADNEFSGVIASDNSQVTVSGGNLIRNANIQTAFGATGAGSTMTVMDVNFQENTGLPGTSALIYSENGGTITGRLLSMTGNTDFIGHFFTINSGTLNIYACCIHSGRSDAIVFVSKDSTYDYTGDNYVNTDVVSEICDQYNHVENRLTLEERDTGVVTSCFVTDDCETDCLEFGNIAECGGALATPPPTLRPTISPEPTQQVLIQIAAPTPFPRPTATPAPVPSGGLIPAQETQTEDAFGGNGPAGSTGGSGGNKQTNIPLVVCSTLLLLPLYFQ